MLTKINRKLHELHELHELYGKHKWVALSDNNTISVCRCGAARYKGPHNKNEKPLSIEDFDGREHSFSIASITASFHKTNPLHVRMLARWMQRNHIWGGKGNTKADITAALACGLRLFKAKEAQDA